MIPSSPNAFLGIHFTPDAHPRGSLAGMLAAMRATLEPTSFGQTLRIEPLRFMDVMPIWDEFGDDEANTLLVDLGSISPNRPAGGISLEQIAIQSGIDPIATFDDGSIVLDDESLGLLIHLASERQLAAVRVGGPIEPRDAEALVNALHRGDAPLEFECRATASLQATGPRSVRLDVRESDLALKVVAEAFRHYVAALRNRDVPSVSAPETWQMQRLLEVAGEICVRPIETQVFASFIDVGICAEAGGPTRPANHSMIYDVFGNSWHDDP